MKYIIISLVLAGLVYLYQLIIDRDALVASFLVVVVLVPFVSWGLANNITDLTEAQGAFVAFIGLVLFAVFSPFRMPFRAVVLEFLRFHAAVLRNFGAAFACIFVIYQIGAGSLKKLGAGAVFNEFLGLCLFAGLIGHILFKIFQAVEQEGFWGIVLNSLARRQPIKTRDSYFEMSEIQIQVMNDQGEHVPWFRILDISPNASILEVTQRKNELLIANDPDRQPKTTLADMEAYEERCRQILAAYTQAVAEIERLSASGQAQ